MMSEPVTTPPARATPTTRPDPSSRAVRIEALKSSRNPGAEDRGRTLYKTPDRESTRSRSRNYDIFLPKQSHIHTPKRQETFSNPDKITRSAGPTRTLSRTESGPQNYRTSLSAVSSSSRDELSDLNTSNDTISIHSDSPFRKRQDFNYSSLPHGRSSQRFKSVDAKAGQILHDYHRDKDLTRLQLYDICTGKVTGDSYRTPLQPCDLNTKISPDTDRTPTNGHVPRDLSRDHHVTFGSETSTPVAVVAPPIIKVSDVNGNEGNGNVIMENGGEKLEGGKPLITAEYYCIKRVNYDELKQKFAETEIENEKTDEAVKKLNMDKEKKSLASSISNFFRKMSPRLHRKSRASSSNSSMGDDDSSSQGSPNHKAKSRVKSPISSPIRRLINGRKHSETDTKHEDKHKHEHGSKHEHEHDKHGHKSEQIEVVKRDLEPSKSLPPRTLNVDGRTSDRGKPRGLLTARSTDSIGECSLDVNMAGSDPSLASGHQSTGSASRRTLRSTDPTKLDLQTDTDPHNCSYLGLSLSVGGYPKYRSYKTHDKETVKTDEKTVQNDKSIQNEDILNANTVKSVRIQNPSVHDTRTQVKTDKVNGVVNVNNSAEIEDEVFSSRKDSGAKSGTKKRVSVESGAAGEGSLNKPVVTSSAAVVQNGAAGESAAIEAVPVDRKRELRRGSVAKGGQFYLARISEQTERIGELVHRAEKDLNELGKTEEVYGKLRAAVGKANLLMSQKFKQFIGLCEANVNPTEEEENMVTTNEDLAGFWDMMLLQVEDVDAAFDEIQRIRDNDWNEIQPPPLYRSLSASSQKESPAEKPKRTPKKSAPRPRQDKSREEARRRLMEAKRVARRKRLTSGGSVDDVEIFIAEPDSKSHA